MKITAGVTNLSELKAVLVGGADEVYGGVLEVTNHRPMTPEYSFPDLDAFAAAIKRTHAGGRKIYFLANELYDDGACQRIAAILRALGLRGVDGALIRDPRLIVLLRRLGFNRELILSSLAAAFNSEALRFYRDLGVRRVVLPQHLSPREIGAIRKRVSIRMEAFFDKREYCKNVDGLCLFHGAQTYRHPRRSRLCVRGQDRRFIGYPCKVNFRKVPAGMASHREIDAYLQEGFLDDLRALFHGGVEYLKVKRYKGNGLLAELWLARSLLQILRSGSCRKKYIKKGTEAIAYAEKIRKGHMAAPAFPS